MSYDPPRFFSGMLQVAGSRKNESKKNYSFQNAFFIKLYNQAAQTSK
jgi:hypothetical protein